LGGGLTWFLTLITGLVFFLFFEVEVYFLGLPGWFIAAALYIIMSYLFQNKTTEFAK
jgi:hypothetical protein